ncbi:hypothetical protein AOXY_G3861 [Acipenser oxyrinchus oxyrinchus]|uniref:Uncharacterized protein n=1 Tax=Acipenser oxyrinchus oxyrinchus TaxID=40147 RepID=A0AAD8GFU3_ACIOX|nr:hypothetical protein AOXY_G3861 [Acipenser oxyrinchus oxyrinchus]
MAGSISLSLHATLIVLSMLSFGLTLFFHVAASTVSINGLFLTTHQNITEKFVLQITPDAWLVSIWTLINAWNGLWLIYVFITLFRRNQYGPVYCNPAIHPPMFYILWIANNLLSIGFLFLWDRQCLVQALGLQILIPYSCYVMLGISYRNLYQHDTWLKSNSSSDLWNVRYLVHNGLALYAAWTSIDVLVNFGIVLKYSFGLMDPAVSTAMLSILLVKLIVWFLLENFVLEKYVRYTFTVYPVVILGLAGMFTRNYRFDSITTNTIYCGVLMAIGAAFCVFRLIAICFYDDNKPSSSPLDEDFGSTASLPALKLDVDRKFGIINNQCSTA